MRGAFGIHSLSYGKGRGTGWTLCPGCCASLAGGYTSGMKTAISIPDDLFADAEQLARELKKSRSRLYGDAMREYVARHSAESVTETLDRVCSEVAPSGEFAQTAARRTLERSDW
jgi:predicted transcriptional regulator